MLVGMKPVSSRAGIPGQVFPTLKPALQPRRHAVLCELLWDLILLYP